MEGRLLPDESVEYTDPTSNSSREAPRFRRARHVSTPPPTSLSETEYGSCPTYPHRTRVSLYNDQRPLLPVNRNVLLSYAELFMHGVITGGMQKLHTWGGRHLAPTTMLR